MDKNHKLCEMYGKKNYALSDERVNNPSKLLCICW